MAMKTSKAKNKKPTFRSQYMKEYKEFYKRLKRLEKRGYSLAERFQPKIPKKIGKKELERIQNKNKLDYIYDKATFYDIESGKTVSGRRGREIERSRASKKGAKKRRVNDISKEPPTFNDAVLREVEKRIEFAQPTHYNPHGKAMLSNFLFERIANDGREFVAKQLQEAGDRAVKLADTILYDSEDKAKIAFIEFTHIVSNRSFTQEEAIWLYDAYADEGW